MYNTTYKIRLVVALVGFAISFTVLTFAQQKDTVDPKIEQHIRALVWKYDVPFNNHAVAAFYTEDASTRQ
jgi:hypothetical protein